MNCMYLKSKKGKPYCKKQKCFIDFKDCDNCNEKEYKPVKIYKMKKNKPIKKRTYKHAKSEKERYSIIIDSLSHCIVCGKPSFMEHIDKHEIFRGRNRSNSKKYGLVIPLCHKCHDNQEIEFAWRVRGQLEAMKYYSWSEQDFIDIFGRSYLKM